MEVRSESKWKQLGELAMSSGKVFHLLNLIVMAFYVKHIRFLRESSEKTHLDWE